MTQDEFIKEIADYIDAEFGADSELNYSDIIKKIKENVENNKPTSLAYTNLGYNEEFDVQVYVDISTATHIVTLSDGNGLSDACVIKNEYGSPDEYLNHVSLDFDNLVGFTDDEVDLMATQLYLAKAYESLCGEPIPEKLDFAYFRMCEEDLNDMAYNDPKMKPLCNEFIQRIHDVYAMGDGEQLPYGEYRKARDIAETCNYYAEHDGTLPPSRTDSER